MNPTPLLVTICIVAMALAQRSGAVAYMTGTTQGMNASGDLAFALDYNNSGSSANATYMLPNGPLNFYAYWECDDSVPWAVWYGFSIPGAPSIPGLSFQFRAGPDWAENCAGVEAASNSLYVYESCPNFYLRPDGTDLPISIRVVADLTSTFDGELYFATGTWSYTVDYVSQDPVAPEAVSDDFPTFTLLSFALGAMAVLARHHRGRVLQG